MEMHPSPLLLLVQANVDAAHEAAFNHYYHLHVPTLMEIPGYVWGRRYLGVRGELRHLAAYEIADPSYLPSLLGPDPEALGVHHGQAVLGLGMSPLGRTAKPAKRLRRALLRRARP